MKTQALCNELLIFLKLCSSHFMFCWIKMIKFPAKLTARKYPTFCHRYTFFWWEWHMKHLLQRFWRDHAQIMVWQPVPAAPHLSRQKVFCWFNCAAADVELLAVHNQIGRFMVHNYCSSASRPVRLFHKTYVAGRFERYVQIRMPTRCFMDQSPRCSRNCEENT